MKVLVINGSPKEVSDTMCLTNAFLKGLNKNKEFDINIVHLIHKNIKPCLGCFKCWKNDSGKCIQEDDQEGGHKEQRQGPKPPIIGTMDVKGDREDAHQNKRHVAREIADRFQKAFGLLDLFA